MWFALERLQAGLSQLHARRSHLTRAVGLLKHDISGARCLRVSAKVTTTATRRVLVRARVCNSLHRRGVLLVLPSHWYSRIGVLFVLTLRNRNIARNGAYDSHVDGIATQHSLPGDCNV